MDFRVSIGNIIAVLIRIEKQVGWHEYPGASAPSDYAAGHVQAIKEGFMFIKNSVPISVLMNGDFVFSLEVIGGRRRNLVENRAQVLVVLDDFHPGGKGVLEVLGDPKTSSFIKIHVQGLRYRRFMRHHLHGKSLCYLKFFDAFFRV